MDSLSHLTRPRRSAALRGRVAPEDEHPDERTAFRVLNTLDRPVWVFDIDAGRVAFANQPALALWKASSLKALRARDMRADMSEAVAARLRQYQQDFERNGARFSEQWTLYPEGVPRTCWVGYSGYRLPDGRMAMLCEVQGEQRGLAPDSLRSVEALLHTEVMVTLYDRRGQALYRNPAARSALPEGWRDWRDHFVDANERKVLLRGLARDGQVRCVVKVATAQGERWHEVSARRCKDAVTGQEATLVSALDVSELKRAEARAQYLAEHDLLTGLPNRNRVIEHYQEFLAACAEAGLEAALVYIDLDHFKHVNDSMGHAAGDELLKQLAARFGAQLRSGEHVARLGGDEFLILCAGPNIEQSVAALVQRVRQLVSEPVRVMQTELRVTPSIGVSLFPRDGEDIDSLMRHADLAMYSAKEAGRNTMAYFLPSMTAQARSRLELELDLRSALERGEIKVYYQPRLDVSTGRMLGAEALVRWRHPVRGMVPPNVFIPVCEDCGLIGALGALVLERAAEQVVAWRRRGWGLTISVNLSPRQFFDTSLLTKVRETLARTGCDPRWLELEITESVLLGHDGSTIATLEALGALGFGIAIDDFGTGYSNLAYLQRYPINCLKIDRSFVNALEKGPALTEMIVSLCRVLQFNMVAEGVETEAQLAWLRERGVHEYQGFLFSPAVPPEAFEQLVLGQA